MNAPRWNTPYADRVRDDLVRLVEQADPSTSRRDGRVGGGRVVDRPRVVVTGIVAVLVAVAAVLAIRAGLERPLRDSAVQPTRSASPAPQATHPSAEVTAELQRALYALLPASARTAPALTWTDARDGATGDAVDTEGRTMLLAAACEGGGTITVTVTGSQVAKPDTVLDCSRLSTFGPFDLSTAGGDDPPGPVGFDVRVSSGHPRYFAKAVAIDSALVTTPPAAPSS